MVVCVSAGSGVLHPGTVGGWSTESEGSLLSSQLSGGQQLFTKLCKQQFYAIKRNMSFGFLHFYLVCVCAGSREHQSGGSAVRFSR